jgi:glucosamine--fructose-6-phosphate aminotransferase (isomerizing)
MVRECKLAGLRHTRWGRLAGIDQSLTAQLAGLFYSRLASAQRTIERRRGSRSHQSHAPPAGSLSRRVLALEPQVVWADDFAKMERLVWVGLHYPIAMEGALKLKEISHIHASSLPVAN